MNRPRSPIEDPSASDSQRIEGVGLFSTRQRLILRRVAAASLLVMLLIFWWSAVYTGLVAGWWLLKGYFFLTEDQNPYVWNGAIDWIFMGLALLTAWPAQRWLRIQIAHFVEDKSDDPYAIFSQIAKQIDGEQIDGAQTPDTEMSSLVHLLARTLDVPYVGIETTPDGLLADYGMPGAASAADLITLPLHYNHSPLGSLCIAPRVIGGAPLHLDKQLLNDLARQISLTLYTDRLSTDLQESRRRIVTAREEARRQLRRDLHDGLGPSLAAMTMQADTARELVYDDPQLAEQLLAEFVNQTQAMVSEIRRIVHGLRPPALDDVGLYGALELLVNGFSVPTLQTAVQLPATRPILSAAMEVAVYRIVQEALTNISKHAYAHTATVTLEAEDDRLILTICDDGVGLPSQPEMGMGLHSMRERAEELGGTLTVRANTPTGSCIFAQFPLEPGESDGSDPYSDL